MQDLMSEVQATRRLGKVMEMAFGVQYHPDHIGLLVPWLGWSHQKPERVSLSRMRKGSSAGRDGTGRE